MHNAAFRELGLDDWRYEAIDVEPERFDDVVRSLAAQGYAGANVTIPHKLRALQAADSASPVAQVVGAANTLVFRDGAVHADNTDAQGFLTALRERVPDAPQGMRALVLGAGGAGRAVAYALVDAGAAAVEVWNRHPERAQDLVSHLAGAGKGAGLSATTAPRTDLADILVNATSVGMVSPGSGHSTPEDPDPIKELPLMADELSDRLIVVDLVYRQERTPLVRAALARSLQCVDGIDVLVHQGAASFRLWTGMNAPLGAMRSGATNGAD